MGQGGRLRRGEGSRVTRGKGKYLVPGQRESNSLSWRHVRPSTWPARGGRPPRPEVSMKPVPGRLASWGAVLGCCCWGSRLPLKTSGSSRDRSRAGRGPRPCGQGALERAHPGPFWERAWGNYTGTKLPAGGDQCTGAQSTPLLRPLPLLRPRPLPWLLETWLQSPGQTVSRGKKKPNCQRNSRTSQPPMALPGSPLLPLKEKWQARSQVFRVGQGTWSTSSSSSSSSSTLPAGGVPGRPPREAPSAGHEGPGCPGAGAAAPEEDAACGARELPAAAGERNCIHHRVPLARGLFTWAWESARAGASSGCGLGEGSEGRGRAPPGGEGGGTTRCGGPSLSGLQWALAEPKAGEAPTARGPRELSSGLCGASGANGVGPRVVRGGYELLLSPSPGWRRQPRALPIRPRLRCASARAAASPAWLRPHLVPQALCSPFRGGGAQRFRLVGPGHRLPRLHVSAAGGGVPWAGALGPGRAWWWRTSRTAPPRASSKLAHQSERLSRAASSTAGVRGERREGAGSGESHRAGRGPVPGPASPRSSRRLWWRLRAGGQDQGSTVAAAGAGMLVPGAPAAWQRRIARPEERRAERRVATSPAAPRAWGAWRMDRSGARAALSRSGSLAALAGSVRSRALAVAGTRAVLVPGPGQRAGPTARGARRPWPSRSRPGAAGTEGRAEPGARRSSASSALCRLGCCRFGARGGSSPTKTPPLLAGGDRSRRMHPWTGGMFAG